MADCQLPTIPDQKTIQASDSKNTSSDPKGNENRKNKRRLTPEESRQLTDKLLEIEQIKYEERLVYEQINHLNIEKQHLRNLLNALRAMDPNTRMTNSTYRQRPLEKVHPKTHSN